MIHALLLAALLSQAPTTDVPLKPPELVDDNGTVTTLPSPAMLDPGVVCLTQGRAKLIRDELATPPSVNWPVVLGITGGVAVVVGVVVGLVVWNVKK